MWTDIKNAYVIPSYMYIYTKYRYYFPKYRKLTYVYFIQACKWFINTFQQGQYDKYRITKYIYERFAYDEKFIEKLKFKELTVLDSGLFDVTRDSNVFEIESPQFIIIPKTINQTVYYRFIDYASLQSIKTHMQVDTDDVDNNDIELSEEKEIILQQNIYDALYNGMKLGDVPYIFLELFYYDPIQDKEMTLMIHEYLKYFCVKDNTINRSVIRYVCLKYYNVDIDRYDSRLNILYKNADKLKELNLRLLDIEPISII